MARKPNILILDGRSAQRPRRCRPTAIASPRRRIWTPWPSARSCFAPLTATARCARPRASRSVAAACLRPSAPTTMPRSSPRRCRRSRITCAAPAIAPCLSGKMHFCGAGSAAWFRGAPDDRHLPGRLRLDAGLGSLRGAARAGTTAWTRSHRPGHAHAPIRSTSTMRSCSTRAARSSTSRAARIAAPFCMVASMTHPHDPYAIAQPYWDRYAGVDIDMPRVRSAAAQADPHSRDCATSAGSTRSRSTRRKSAPRAAPTMAPFRTSTTRSARCSPLWPIRASRRTPSSCVLADHGDMLGERGLWYKMNFFEPACRIPLIVHAPRRFSPRAVAESASLIDMLPTF